MVAGEWTSEGGLLDPAGAIVAFSRDGVLWDRTARSKTKSEFQKRPSQPARRPYLSGRTGELPTVRLVP